MTFINLYINSDKLRNPEDLKESFIYSQIESFSTHILGYYTDIYTFIHTYIYIYIYIYVEICTNNLISDIEMLSRSLSTDTTLGICSNA